MFASRADASSPAGAADGLAGADRYNPPPMARGVLLMVLATLGFTLMLACVKQARTELSTVEVMAWRGAVAVPLCWWIARRHGGLRLQRRRLFVVRAVIGFGAMFCAFTAARGLAVADLSFVWRMQPVFVAALAPLALGVGERPGRRTLLVLAGGLAGCALMFGPDLRLDRLGYAAVALAGAALSAAAHVSLRALGATERTTAVVFWFQAAVAGLALAACLATTGLPAAPPALLPYLIGSGVFATAAQILMTRAYALERASIVSAAGYLGPVWGLAIDLVAFARAPAPHELVGGAVIVAASAALLFPADRPRTATRDRPRRSSG